MRRWTIAAGVFALTYAVAEPADAAPPAASGSAGATVAAPSVSLWAHPAFGTDAWVGDGWFEVVARIENRGSATAKGTVEAMDSGGGFRPTRTGLSVRAPFSVPAGRSAEVRLPLHEGRTIGGVTVRVLDDAGAALAETALSINTTTGPLLVDASQPSRLSVALRGWTMTPRWNRLYGSAYGWGTPSGANLGLGTLTVDSATGDLMLPQRAPEYSPATALVLRSDALAKVDGPALDALATWLLSGGTLAVVVTRPEDLRQGTLVTFAGGEIRKAAPSSVLLSLPVPTRPTSGGSLLAPAFDPDAAPMRWTPGDRAGATEIAFEPIRSTTPTPTRAPTGPGAAVREKLVGFEGANLRPTAFGSSAPYGLGEVHLLSFDPTETPGVDDPWVQGSMINLIHRAWDRQAKIAFPLGTGNEQRTAPEIRRALDPNENFRPALAIAAVLLVLYSILAGPVTFLRSARKGRPLDPLLWAPLFSLAAFGLIVLVGLAGKGFRGRARRIALVEAGAGMSRAPVRRYRGFFASQARTLAVKGSERQSVLDLAHVDPSRERPAASLRLDRAGAQLENITALPWQTVVVAEDGVLDLRGGVSVIPTPDGYVDVINRTGKALEHVLVYVPLKDFRWFERVDAGARVHAADGRFVQTSSSRARTMAGSLQVHGLEASRLGAAIGGRAGSDFQTAWAPFGTAAGTAVDWWPESAAVVLAEAKGGEGVKADAGLSVDSDRLFLRIVGEGGEP